MTCTCLTEYYATHPEVPLVWARWFMDEAREQCTEHASPCDVEHMNGEHPDMPLSFERVCPGFQELILGGWHE